MLNTIHARKLRITQTDGERKMWHFLRNRRLGGYKFRRQHPIGPYIADFCCIEKYLVIEVDGSQHATQIKKDTRRTYYLNNQGYLVLRFWADAVVRETTGVLETILCELEKYPHPSPLPEGEGERKL